MDLVRSAREAAPRLTTASRVRVRSGRPAKSGLME